ncbi:MAG: formate dehydrogenase subunit gamma [Nitrospiraceae bacterium]|nr:MAG: formate dehydrogenase subunit gamma [Nitrospiraceae bacterium]
MKMVKMIQKTTAFERIVHLLLALSCLALLLTGLGFLYQQELGWLNTIFGGVHIARGIHNWGGIVFIVSLIFSLGTWVPECLKWTSDDSKWLGMLGGYLSREKDKEIPPQGKINAGQKLLGIVVFISGVIISISGLILWLSVPSALWVLIHNVCALLFAVFVPVHIYLATAANPGTFRIMTRGDVPLYWAKKKHPKWVKEIGAG